MSFLSSVRTAFWVLVVAVAFVVVVQYAARDPLDRAWTVEFPACAACDLPAQEVRYLRQATGVLECLPPPTEGTAAQLRAAARALGYAHATDRATQLLFSSIVGQGRVSECIKANNDTLLVDLFLRGLGFAHEAEQAVALLEPELLAVLEAYAAGINQYLLVETPPLEFLLVQHRPQAWTPKDSLIFVRLMSYLGLSSNDGDLEKVLLQWSRHEKPWQVLREVFSPLLNDVTPEMLAVYKEVKVQTSPLPADLIKEFIPSLAASNNWAVAPHRTTSGSAAYCSDPHLEVSRMPPFWHESVVHLNSTFWVAGAALPGLPFHLMGRTNDVAWGFTYGCADGIDYWIEKIENGKYRRGDSFLPLERRVETILRKGLPSATAYIFSTPNGVLERKDVTSATIEDGYYLARRTTMGLTAGLDSLAAVPRALTATSAKGFLDAIRSADLTANWIAADRNNIGYQQSAKVPKRASTGVFPLLGWEKSHDWNGFHPSEDLASVFNPPSGVIATANNEILPQEGKVKATTVHMGPHRLDRVYELLGSKDKHSIDDMKRYQVDVFSNHAKDFMAVLRAVAQRNASLAQLPGASLLLSWDGRYPTGSKGAALFERFYKTLNAAVFGRVFGQPAWAWVRQSTLHIMFFHWWDRLVLGFDQHAALLQANETRDALFVRAFVDTLRELDTDGDDDRTEELREEYSRISMFNVFFDGALDRVGQLLGVDMVDVPMFGCRGCVAQHQRGFVRGRPRMTGASWRFVTDLGTRVLETALPGGNSGRFLSNLYRNRLEEWSEGRYSAWKPELA